MRLRSSALYSGSAEARSLHACTIHSTAAASTTTTPPLKTIGFDAAPTAMAPTPIAATTGHMLCPTGGCPAAASLVACSDIAETLPSRV